MQTFSCSYWDAHSDAIFNGLNEGEELTLRASASGYASKGANGRPSIGAAHASTL